VEDAAAVARHDVVIFADADVAGREPFAFYRIEAKVELSFSSHDCDPQAVLALAHDLFGARTQGYVLAMRGYEFNEFGERLSDAARANLESAVRFVADLLKSGGFREAALADTVADATAESVLGE
jgi:hydrogenase maturation protease